MSEVPGRWRTAAWLLGAAASLVALGLAWQVLTWPAVGALVETRPETTAFIERYKERESAAGRRPRVDWRWVSYAAISNDLKRSVLVAEDIDFFSHRGFATAEIEKAMREAWEEGELPRGASTITQQLAKNLLLSGERTLLRKGQEFVLTLALELLMSKQRILEIYLNSVEWGEGIFGAEAAAQHYYRKSAARLTAYEAARLSVMLPRPKYFEKLPQSAYLSGRSATIVARMPSARLP